MFKKILVPLDLGRPQNVEMLCSAVRDLSSCMKDVELRLMTVMPDYGTPLVASFFPEGSQEKLVKEIKDELEATRAKYFKDLDTSLRVRQGKRANKILIEAKSWEPDLIVMGCRRKNSRGGDRLSGSSVASVTGRAHCSVMVIRK